MTGTEWVLMKGSPSSAALTILQTLIWSGACIYGNRHVFAFKPISMGGVQHLKFYLPPNKEDDDDIPESEKIETGVIMNNQYEEVSRTSIPGDKTLDSHEFRPQPNGKQALITTNWKTDKKAVLLDQGERSFHTMGFQEIDMATGKPMFDWDPWDHGVMYNESCDTKGMHNFNEAWDWAHINSVDKNFKGDYLISIRHTSTIYKISGKDGSVMWRLGGCTNMSDFEMDDGVQFYWQHHARFRYENATHTVISLFDNASEDWQDRNPSIPQARSSGKILLLDHARHTAKMLRRFDRPDGQTSNALGSLQTLGDDVATANVLVNWAWQGYFGEYDAQNRLVMEAKFESDRHRTYRAYKYPWVGRPLEPPVLKVLPIGHSTDDVASAFYVSWNGATEVKSWAFYGGNALDAPFKLLATVDKRGFETSWVLGGAVKFAYAEALDAEGAVLGKSTTTSILPQGNKEFRIAAPLLDGVVAFDRMPGAAQTGSLSVCKHVDSGAKGVFSTLFSLSVGVFAIFGVFGVARKVLDEVLRRQKGYRVVSTLPP